MTRSRIKSKVLPTFALLIFFSFVMYCITNDYINRYKRAIDNKIFWDEKQKLSNDRRVAFKNVHKVDSYLQSFVNLVDLMQNRSTSGSLFNMISTKHLNANKRLLMPEIVEYITNVTINNKYCNEDSGKDVTLVVFVFARIENFVSRIAIRNTWAKRVKQNYNIKMYFAVGMSQNKTVMNLLNDESNTFRDIVQFGFDDSIEGSDTLKSLAVIRWTAINCQFANFLLKV